MRPEPCANQKRQLEEKLSSNGWKIVTRDAENLEWWADEQWVIESEWSPQGFRLWLTFVIDPMCAEPRLKGMSVDEVVASNEPPTDLWAPVSRARRSWW